MRTSPFAVALIALALALNCFAGTQVVPTTTLTAETSNNTSTADSFAGQTNGNIAATNISKEDMRTLLYPGATTQIYAHFMGWFGGTNHVNVGYRSDDLAQIHRQFDDMLSRGIAGAILDWYGQNNREDATAKLMMQDAETRGGQFVFAVMYDGGAMRGCTSATGNCTDKAIADLTYAYNTYETSPAYLKIDGRPVVPFFDPDRYGTLDWNRIRSSVPGNPIFIFQNGSGFAHNQSGGSFTWVGINSSNRDDWGEAYYDAFYSAALANPTKHAFGGTKKGFNDTIAAWTGNRIVNQNCGQTWLNTWNEIGKYYNSSTQLESIQLVTWNDYEEGTELESGIDNCLSIAASASGSTVSWTITGNENTIDHYTLFISIDGQNLMPLPDVPAGTRSLNLSSFDFPAGTYTVYVKAVGKPSIKNHMSAGVSYTAIGTVDPGPSGDFVLAAAPASLVIARGQSANYQITVSPQNGFSSTVSLACSGLPSGMSCSFSPAALASGTSTLTLTASTTMAANTAPVGASYMPLLAFLPGLGVAGMAFTVESKRRKLAATLGLCLVLGLSFTLAGCGGGSAVPAQLTSQTSATSGSPPASDPTPSPAPPATTTPVNFVVTATSGTVQHSITLTANLQ